MTRQAETVVGLYNTRGAFEQRIKEGKGAVKWTRLSGRAFAADAVRRQRHPLAHDLGTFLLTMATRAPTEDWSPARLKQRLINLARKGSATAAASLSRWPRLQSRAASWPTSCG